MAETAISRSASWPYLHSMSWRDRKEEPGAIHHVTSRGTGKMAIFSDDRSRERLLAAAGESVERFGWVCHAYVLMDNHFHFLIQTPEPNLGEGMQLLNATYAQWFNGHIGRRGHLFEDRYRSVRIETQEHLLEVCRYVVLNRVRAGACTAVVDWKWSSFHATAGLIRPPRYLTVDWVIAQFGNSRDRYRRFVAEGSPFASLEGLLAA
jgi:REP element-mobilizing transposase RayT